MLFSIDFNTLFYHPAKNNKKNPQVFQLFSRKLTDSYYPKCIPIQAVYTITNLISPQDDLMNENLNLLQ